MPCIADGVLVGELTISDADEHGCHEATVTLGDVSKRVRVAHVASDGPYELIREALTRLQPLPGAGPG